MGMETRGMGILGGGDSGAHQGGERSFLEGSGVVEGAVGPSGRDFR